MKFTIHDFLYIFLGFVFGIYELFINSTPRLYTKIVGMLSLILAIWILVSCLKSIKNKTKR
ncbi:hypothetical protein J2S10_004664 [Neobacillus ginsengisoli]|uniref:Uncharacterized protein n=1 Tax=Neobacillus ginsengisoli TaxID=904295 RepID=A0ABT9Y0X1_9BACI|nr:hypothetical protein [Neobacillus ginsengisoli]